MSFAPELPIIYGFDGEVWHVCTETYAASGHTACRPDSEYTTSMTQFAAEPADPVALAIAIEERRHQWRPDTWPRCKACRPHDHQRAVIEQRLRGILGQNPLSGTAESED